MNKLVKGLLPLALAGMLTGCELMPGEETTPTVEDVEEELDKEVETSEGEGNINTMTPQAEVGEAITASNGAMYTLSAVDFSSVDPANYYEAEEGHSFMYCTVMIQNNSAEELSYSPSDWRIVDGAGREISVSSEAAYGVADEMTTGKLEAGGVVQATLSFEVPDAQDVYTLFVYGPLVVNVTPLASWTINR